MQGKSVNVPAYIVVGHERSCKVVATLALPCFVAGHKTQLQQMLRTPTTAKIPLRNGQSLPLANTKYCNSGS